MALGSLPWALIRAPIPTAQPERDRAVLLVLAALTEREGEPVRTTLTALAARCRVANLRYVRASLQRLAEAGLLAEVDGGVRVEVEAIDALGRDPAWGRLPRGDGLARAISGRHDQSCDGVEDDSLNYDDRSPRPVRLVATTSAKVVATTSPTGRHDQCSIYGPFLAPSFTGPFLPPSPTPPREVRAEQEVGVGREVGQEEIATLRAEQVVMDGREVGWEAPGGLGMIAREATPRRTREELDAELMARLFPSASPRPLLAPLAATLTAVLGGYQRGTGEGEEETINAAWEELAACTSRDILGELRARLVTRARRDA